MDERISNELNLFNRIMKMIVIYNAIEKGWIVRKSSKGIEFQKGLNSLNEFNELDMYPCISRIRSRPNSF